MKFEKISYVSGKKGILIGFVIAFILVIVINLFFTRAKYKLVESRKLASGTINYTLVDFELVEIKVKGLSDSDYRDGITTIPEGNYVLNEEKSYCTEKYVSEDNSFEDVKNESLKINFDSKAKTISVSPYSKKGTKCHLYLEEKQEPKLLNGAVIALSTKKHGTFTGTSCDNGCGVTENGVYEAEDDFGTSYYYRGTVDNNWVVFGKDKGGTNYLWWRIIRINGNGTIRLIYAGTSSSNKNAPNATGRGTMITPRTPASAGYSESVKFNTKCNDNKYVGYMYGGANGVASTSYSQAHNPETPSTVLEEIKYWYENKTNLGSLATKIDVDTGFCGDRTYTTNNHGNNYPGTGNLGYGKTATVYGAADRVWQANSESWKTDEQTATYKCTTPTRDLYTGPSAMSGGTKGLNGNVEGNNALPVPVGLITMDEVIHAGGFAGKSNYGYWLYIGRYYWTMSPVRFAGSYATVFYVHIDGILKSGNVDGTNSGVRPVINLKADTMVTGSGNSGDPFVVQISN